MCCGIKVHLEFWDKLKSATKYLFGRKRKDGDFDSFEFLPTDAAKLHRMVSGLRAC